MRGRRVLVAFAAATWLARAQAGEAFRCSARGGAVWHEYRSRHFLLDTDVSGGKAESLVRDLETMHALVVQALVGGQAEIPGRVRVVAPGDAGLFRELAGSGDVGAYQKNRGGSLMLPAIVLPATEASSETIAHEFAHHLSWFLFPRQPAWFSEGLAGFAQTVARYDTAAVGTTGSRVVRGEPGRARYAGLVPSGFVDALATLQPVPPKELLEWRGSMHDERGRFHVWSWLLYHCLWNTRSQQFRDYRRRLSDGEDPKRAWVEVFPEFDPEKPGASERLAKELRQYLQVPFHPYPVSAWADGGFTASPLRPADVHLLLLGVRATRDEKAPDPLVRAELAEALSEDPAQPEAVAWKAQLDGVPAVPELRKVVSARPGDWRGWLLLGEAIRGDGSAAEKEAASRTAVTLNPESARANHALAWQLVTTGRAREALTWANRALDLAPWDPGITDTLAAVAVSLGKCAEALALEQRAVDLLPAGATGEEELRRRLLGYRERCAPQATPPSSSSPAGARAR
ncbi:MAG TPA: hypothetical protein VMK42_03825 [Anaeromyxobacteraceae bacterium]|nr:hypothetical protein [Anaeromyxobacteraceae bacterium]